MKKQILIYDFISSNQFSFSMFSIIEIINFFFFFSFFFICSIFKTSTLYSLSFYIKWRNYTIFRRVKIDHYRTSFSKKFLINNFDKKKNRKKITKKIINKFLKSLFVNQWLNCLIQFQIDYINQIIYRNKCFWWINEKIIVFFKKENSFNCFFSISNDDIDHIVVFCFVWFEFRTKK